MPHASNPLKIRYRRGLMLPRVFLSLNDPTRLTKPRQALQSNQTSFRQNSKRRNRTLKFRSSTQPIFLNNRVSLSMEVRSNCFLRHYRCGLPERQQRQAKWRLSNEKRSSMHPRQQARAKKRSLRSLYDEAVASVAGSSSATGVTPPETKISSRETLMRCTIPSREESPN